VTGRFIQKDPIGILGGLNVYTYAGNNPVTYMDPEGLIEPITTFLVAGTILLSYGGACFYLRHDRSYTTINNLLAGAHEYFTHLDQPGNTEKWYRTMSETGNIPNAVMDDLWDGQKALWDKILGTSPIGWETHWGGYGFSNTYSTVKSANDTVNGDGFDAGRNAAESVPGPFGQAWNAINNWIDAWTADQDNKCK
jgi:uncharacterized protein RhaS with RHS repeats